MIGAKAWERLAPDLQEVAGADAIVLQDDVVCYVEEGSVGLFSVEVEDGVPSGPRRLLHRLGSGQAAFSTPFESYGRKRFLVVPVQEAVVRTISLRALWRDMVEHGTPLVPLIEEWVELLAALLSDPTQKEAHLRLTANGEQVVEEPQSLGAAPGTVLWCQAHEGALRWMGSKSMELDGEAGPMPVAMGMWARPEGRVRLSAWETQGADDSTAILRGLGQLHRLIRVHLLEVEELERDEELLRLRRRDAGERARTEQAMSELASVLETAEPTALGGTPIFKAFAAVTREMGVDAVEPAAQGRTDALDAISRASRVRTRRVTLRGGWWRGDVGSFLAFSEDEEHRPVAILRRRSGTYDVYDPVADTKQRLTPSLARELASEAVVLYRPLPDGALRLVDLVRFSLKGRGRDLATIFLTGLGATLLAMVVPQATAVLMDHAIPDADRRLLFEIGAGLLAAALGRTIFSLSQGMVLLRFELGSEADSQAALWDRLLRLRPSFFRDFSSGDLQSRVMAVSQVGRTLSGVTLSTIFSSSLALLNLGLLYYYSPLLSLIAVIVGAVVMAFTVTASSFMRSKIRERVELEGRFFGQVIQVINGVSKIKVARAEERAFVHWMRSYSRQLKLSASTERIEDLIFVFNRLVPTLATAVLFIVALDMLGSSAPGAEGLTLGTFLAFTTAFAVFLGGATSLSNTIVRVLDIGAQSARIRPILNEEPEIDATKTHPGVLSGRMALSDVEFRYREDGPKILDEVSLQAEPGEFVAIVGPSGSGKSTILRLLLGFEKPDSGAVSYDGQDLAGIDVLDVRRQIGVVLQSGTLDSGSVFENICCGSVLSLDEAWAAAEAAGLADEIREMPMGMHTIVSVGGGNLSGGQRQRLLIARALAPRPRVLFFDEATSALDNKTQAHVAESLDRLKVTRVVIAHRLSTIKNADRIYVLDKGRVVQSGRFDDLIDAEGPFKFMMARQVA